MSYTDTLQSYQDRLSSMIENEDTVGDYLLNKGQEKINAYLEKAGIPAELGGVFDQISLLSNNSAVKALIEKSGLKGVLDEQMESVNRNVDELTSKVKQFAQNGVDFVDEQVSKAKTVASSVLERTQGGIDAVRSAETQGREALETARGMVSQGQEAVSQAQEAVSSAVAQGQEAVYGAVAQGQEAVSSAVAQGQEAVSSAVAQGQEAVSSAVAQGQEAVSGVPSGFGSTEGDFQGMIEDSLRSAKGAQEISEPVAQQVMTKTTNYQLPEESFTSPPSQELTEFARDTSAITKGEEVTSDLAKVGTGLEETGELPGVGEVTEVLGALLQIGSLIASAFKPHETAPNIVTPVSGFGFGSLNQVGGASSSIV